MKIFSSIKILVCVLAIFFICFSTGVVCFGNFQPNVLTLEGAKNIRDLGGFSISEDKLTKNNAFLRSEVLDDLTYSDINILLNYGVKSIIDLRTEKEILLKPDVQNLIQNVQYKNIEFNINPEFIKTNMSDFYISMLEKKEPIKEIFEFISENSMGTILFHCTHGKDRTGIISLILLGLAGVNEKELIEDYSISYELIKEKPIVKNGISKRGPNGYLSEPQYIKPVIAYIYEKYSTFENYLFSCGIGDQTIKLVKNKLADI